MFFLVSLLMDISGLLTAAVCCNQKITAARLLLVPAGAVILSMLLLGFLPGYISYVLIMHAVVNPLMVLLVFRPESLRDFLRLWLTVYLVLAVAGGIQQSIRLQTGMNSEGQILFCGILAMALFIVWQCRQRVLGRVCLVELSFSGQTISLKAFCDSGNLLRDPDSGMAVSILRKEVFPEEWAGELSETARWIPFSTIGRESAEIQVVTLDKMRIFLKGTVKEIDTPRIGLHEGKFMSEPGVQMLLNGSFC